MALVKATARVDALLWACTLCKRGGLAFTEKEREAAIAGHHCGRKR